MSEKRVIITGATGMVGGCALRICLENPDISLVTVIGRGRHVVTLHRLSRLPGLRRSWPTFLLRMRKATRRFILQLLIRYSGVFLRSESLGLSQ
jgi:hypothetical protein